MQALVDNSGVRTFSFLQATAPAELKTSPQGDKALLLRGTFPPGPLPAPPTRLPPARGAPRSIPYKALKPRPPPRPVPLASPADEVMRGSYWSAAAAPPEPERARSRL